MEKYLYCPKCDKYPDEVIDETVARWRKKWDTTTKEYEIVEGIDMLLEETSKSFCGVCEEELMEICPHFNLPTREWE